MCKASKGAIKAVPLVWWGDTGFTSFAIRGATCRGDNTGLNMCRKCEQVGAGGGARVVVEKLGAQTLKIVVTQRGR